MKKIILITGVIVYTLFAVSLFTSAKTERNGDNMQFLESSPKILKEDKEQFLYILTVSDGVIVVKNKENRIVKKTDTIVSVLPKQDRENLEKGIKVKSEKELSRLLEDFCS